MAARRPWRTRVDDGPGTRPLACGLVLESVRAADHVRCGAGLLHHMGEVMRQQPPSLARARFVLPRPNHEVPSPGVSAPIPPRADRSAAAPVCTRTREN